MIKILIVREINIMSNLISGVIGSIIGSCISGFFAWLLYKTNKSEVIRERKISTLYIGSEILRLICISLDLI